MYPLVGDLAAGGIPVAVTCRVLGFSKQAYYAWRKNPVSQRDFNDAYRINAALDIHADDPAFGYRFIADELPAHGITAGPNRLWLTDITERPTAEGKLYLCAIKDMHSGRIVGYSTDSQVRASLAVAALSKAIRLPNPAATIVHSDRGSQSRNKRISRKRCTATDWSSQPNPGQSRLRNPENQRLRTRATTTRRHRGHLNPA